MKKFIVAAAALLISVSSFAQFGLVGGLTTSSTDLKSASVDLETGNINQYHFGVTYKIPFGGMFAIQPSLIYNVKGASLGTISKANDINFKTGFVELPVQLQAGVNLFNVVRVYGLAEPFIGYAITNEINISDKISFSNKGNNEKVDWENVKSRLEYGVSLGAGAELFSFLQVSVKYFWNLGNLYNQKGNIPGVDFSQVAETKCNGISLSVAFLF